VFLKRGKRKKVPFFDYHLPCGSKDFIETLEDLTGKVLRKIKEGRQLLLRLPVLWGLVMIDAV
jgi:hypothetical protein